tara:strand:+ start:35 stop:547 length:513 start_codon:yes stop_codon:yes gene_type:complete
MKGMNKFEVIIKSDNKMNGDINSAEYNLSSVYDNAPQAEKYANNPYCYVKVKYFSLKKAYTSTGSIFIKINSSLPNSLETQTLSSGKNSNFSQSSILGVVPTGATGWTGSSTSYDNEYVACANIFKGNINIQLTDEDGTLLTGLSGSTPYILVVCVYFDDPDPENKSWFY